MKWPLDISLHEIVQTISDAGLLGMLLIIVYGAAQEWWVWGWLYREMRADRDYWRDIALRAAQIAEKAATNGPSRGRKQ